MPEIPQGTIGLVAHLSFLHVPEDAVDILDTAGQVLEDFNR